ncbi:MAG: hypothetical protein QHC90_04060 [Shinella sp.]|nr:hypothetical protein [Shinella sp.]
MKPETHKPQDQPAEGDRETIERELKRQDEKIPERNKKAMDEAAPQTGTRPGP